MVETWIIFAISFAFFHAVGTVFDKIVLKSKSVESLSLSSLRLGLNAIFALAIVLLLGFAVPSSNILFETVLLSLVWLGAVVFYFLPMKQGDVSQLIPFREVITTFLSFILAIILLSEVVSIYDLIGTIAIVVGGYTLLADGKIVMPKPLKVLALIAIDGLFLAIFGVVAKPVSLKLHPILLNFYMYSFVTLFLFAFNSGMNYKNQLKTFKAIFSSKKLLGLVLGASLGATIGTLSLFYGLTTGQAAEVLPITRLLPVFAVLIAWFTLKEKYRMIRLIGSLITFAGVYLIAL